MRWRKFLVSALLAGCMAVTALPTAFAVEEPTENVQLDATVQDTQAEVSSAEWEMSTEQNAEEYTSGSWKYTVSE